MEREPLQRHRGSVQPAGLCGDRNRRQYLTYTSKPPTLQTEIGVSDVALFATGRLPEAQNGSTGNGAAERQLPDGREPDRSGGAAVPESWVAAVAGEETLHRLRAHEGIPFQLAGGAPPCASPVSACLLWLRRCDRRLLLVSAW